MPTKNHFPDQGKDRDIDGEHCDCWTEAAKERRKVPALKQNRLSENIWSKQNIAIYSFDPRYIRGKGKVPTLKQDHLSEIFRVTRLH